MRRKCLLAYKDGNFTRNSFNSIKQFTSEVRKVCLCSVTKMNNPSLYHKANQVQRHDAEQLIKEYSHKLQWRSDGQDSLLDIGTGSGDVLMDFIYTIMPKQFERVVGSDVSPNMMDYAKDFYKSYEKCDFKVLDIGTEQDLPSDMKEQFDHVTSFYCLHWIQNKKQAVQNIFNLLRAEGGDCLLMLLASNPIYDVYTALSKSSKWSSYMTDLEQFINPLHYSKHPDREFSEMLTEAGFSDVQVEIKNKIYSYESAESFLDNMKPINPFLDRIPASLHHSYFNDIVKIVGRYNLIQDPSSKETDDAISLPYKLIVACAKKYGHNARG